MVRETELTTVIERFKGIFDENRLNEVGKEIGFCDRLRTVTPYRIAILLIGLFATQRVETIADVVRGFAGLFDEQVQYKPFHNQLRKSGFANFMHEVVKMLLSEAVMQMLKPKRVGVLKKFKSIIIQDGSSFAVKNSLREIFPGRFKTISPAAVELHTTFDLLKDSPTTISLRPDSDSEQLELPAAKDLPEGALILIDRGYFNLVYFEDVDKEARFFLGRGKKNLNAQIVAAYDESSKGSKRRRVKKLETLRMKQLTGLSKATLLDLDVVAPKEGARKNPFSFRVIVFWSQKENAHQYLVTNLSRDELCASDILLLYRLRWQVELLFKEWKSYANLHAFDTEQQSIVEGFIWAAIGAAIVKRFFAHATQLLMHVETSTRIVAMCISTFLNDVFNALIKKNFKLIFKNFKKLFDFLAANAQRAHPKRDRLTGKLALGLNPIIKFC